MKHVHDRQQLAFACFVSCVEKGLSVRSEAAEFGFLLFVCLTSLDANTPTQLRKYGYDATRGSGCN